MTDHWPPESIRLPDIDDIDDDLDDLDLSVCWSFDYATMTFIDDATGLPVLVDGEINPAIGWQP